MRKAISVNTLQKSCARELDSSPFLGVFRHFLGDLKKINFNEKGQLLDVLCPEVAEEKGKDEG
jgi:hypothetical protein